MNGFCSWSLIASFGVILVGSVSYNNRLRTKIEEGMQVEKDQVLARLDDANVATSYALAEAQLRSAVTVIWLNKVIMEMASSAYV